MTSFWDAFNAEADAARSTVDGAAFVAAGFTVQMTGGGCMAWEAHSADGKAFVWITDAEGFSVTLATAEDDAEDHYLIGLHIEGQDPDSAVYVHARRDPAEAIAMAADLLASRGGVDQAVRRQRLATEYVRVVGYDPFADCPTIDIEEVAEIIREMPATIAAEGA